MRHDKTYSNNPRSEDDVKNRILCLHFHQQQYNVQRRTHVYLLVELPACEQQEIFYSIYFECSD